MLKKTIGCLFLAISSQAASPVWKDGEFLLWSYGREYIAPSDFCFALRYENEKIGSPACSYAGDWERDTTVALYAKWLSSNLDSRIRLMDLRPRNQHVIERMRALKDKSLLYSTIRNDTAWFLLFDETSLDPGKMLSFSLREDSAKAARKIASSWFGGAPQRRLSDEEREAKEKEPDASFAEQPKHDFWLGLGAGWSRAKVPLTPDSWYRRKMASRVENFRNVRDSSSAWSFLEDSSPIYSAYAGGSLYDFIGLELELRRSKHNVKTAEADDSYSALEHWSFSRYEIMLALEFTTAFKPIKNVELKPYASASVVYSIYSEDIKDSSCSYNCEHRFKFENYYNGAAITAGLRTALFESYALNLRAGIINRSAVVAKENLIASSTTDAFVAAALEYHIRWIF